MFLEGSAGGLPGLVRLVRLVRVLRILRIGRLLKRLSAQYQVRSAMGAIFRFVFGLFLFVHVLGCLAFIVARISAKCEEDVDTGTLKCAGSEEGKEEEKIDSWANGFELLQLPQSQWGQQYFISIYFAVSTISTVGFGDITPKNDTEIAYTIFMEAVGMSLFCYTVSTVGALVNGLKAKTARFRVNLDKLLEYMDDKDTPKELRQRVIAYMNFVDSSRFFTDSATEEILSLLSPTLREELVAEAYHAHLWTIPFIRDTATGVGEAKMEGFVAAISQRVRSAAAAPGDLVVKQGEVGKVLFILLTGSVRVFTDSRNAGKSLYEITSRDESPFFGFVEMMMYISNPLAEHDTHSLASVEAVNFCDLAYVDREGFMDAIAEVGLALP
eukprot:COSAG05_NODE_725_length_7716_cov_46.424314_6_plen_384_part_00